MRRFVLAASAAVLLATTACSGGSSGGSSGGGGEEGDTLTLAPIQNPTSFIPGDMGLGNEVQYFQPVYDPLLRLDENGEPVENLATAWSYDETNTVLTLTLRDGVTFTDGAALDAAAVKASLEKAKAGTNEPATQLRFVSTVEAPDATTVVITLSAPDPSLLANLGSIAGMIASPQALDDPALATAPVGSGPYVLDAEQTTANSRYVYTRNADHWNAEDFPFDEIVLTPLTDSTAKVNALRSGQVDGTLLTAQQDVQATTGGDLTQTEYNPGDTAGVFIWDRTGQINPAFADVRVRQAINHAFDREAIVEDAYGGLGTPTEQLFNPDSTAFDESLDGTYAYDPDRARQLLAEAGYADGLTVVMPDLSGFFPTQSTALTEQLAAVGITAQYEAVPPDQVIAELLAGRFAMSFFALANFRSWDTTQIALAQDALWNPLKTADPTVADLIGRAQTAASEDEAAAAYQELNAHVVDQGWFAPWLYVENVYVTSSDVTFTPQPFAAVPPIYNFAPAS